VQGTPWGWTSGGTLSAFAAAALGGALFWYRTVHHAVPVVEPALLRVRSFAWSNVTALAFSTAFAANLLCAVLWLQQVWGASALRTGLEVAPGPLMVPVFAIIAGLLIKRGVGIGVVASAGCLLSASGALIMLTSVGPDPAYASQLLPGWLVGGAGVGLALPTILSSATADLPPARAATGSAVVTMSRQVGSVLGVSLLVALLGIPVGYDATHRAFQSGWAACAVISVLAAVTALGMTPRRPPVLVPEPVAVGAG
jgi:hypothetical protein